MKLMVEKHFTAITVQDIVDRAEVNRGTFYTHFPDKYALLVTIIYEQLQHILSTELYQATGWNRKSLYLLIYTILDVLQQAYDRCPPTKMTNPLLTRAIQKQLAEQLLSWLRQPSIARWPVPIEILATTLSWSILGAALEWFQDGKRCTAEQMTHHILNIIVDGAGGLTPGGIPD